MEYNTIECNRIECSMIYWKH